jgi:hypothetical protein
MSNYGFFSGSTIYPMALLDEVQLFYAGTSYGSYATFRYIPGEYRSLKIWGIVRSNYASGNTDSINVFFNGDFTTANYRSEYNLSYTSSLTRGSSATAFAGNVPNANSPTGAYGLVIIDIPYYKEIYTNKVAISFTSLQADASSVYNETLWTTVVWAARGAAGLYQIDLALSNGTYLVGSKFALYGIA